MRVLAIGATGFIDSQVVRRLLEQGHEVAVFHRGDTNPDPLIGAEHIRADRTALAEMQGELYRFAPAPCARMRRLSHGQAHRCSATCDSFPGC